ncbi:MAG: hypothetical protein JST65_21930, partial [Acidobacteria bacterium]|nr:hypothetical protein [Acidobacteriota bacterium]
MSYTARLFLLAFPTLLAAQPQMGVYAGMQPPEGAGIDLQIAGTTRATRIAEDYAGNLYFAGVNVIYKVTTAGFVTRLAGTGWSSGSTGDGVLARDSRLYNPFDPTFGSDGRIYCRELAPASRMRAVDLSTGLIQTVPLQALAQSTAIGYPFTFDVSGSIYHVSGGTVYRVNAATGAQTALATPSGSITDLAFDAVGSLFLLDGVSGGPLLRELNIQSGQISTLIAAGPQGTSFRRVRFLPGGDFLFIGSTIERYSITNGTFQRLAGALSQTPVSDGASADSAGLDFRDALYRGGTNELVFLLDGLAPLWRIDQATNLYRPIVDNRSPAYSGVLPSQSLVQSPGDTGAALLYAPPTGGLALEIPGRSIVRIPSVNSIVSNLAEVPAASYTLAGDSGENYYARAAFVSRRASGQTSFQPYIASRPDPAVSVENTGFGLDWYGTPVAATTTGRFYRWTGSDWQLTGALATAQHYYTTGRIRVSPDGRIHYLSGAGITRFDPATSTADVLAATGTYNASPVAFDIDEDGFLYYASPATPYSTLYRKHPFTGVNTAIAGGGSSREASGAALSAQIAIGDLAVDRVTGDVYFREAMLPQIRVVTGVRGYNNPGAAV